MNLHSFPDDLDFMALCQTKNPNYRNTLNTMTALSEKHSKVRLFSIGKTVQKRDICGLSIGNQENPVLYVGGTHAEEWLTSWVLLCFFNDVLESIIREIPLEGIEFSAALQKKGLILIPALNPDGIEIALHGSGSAGWRKKRVDKIMQSSSKKWQANVRGVDLNHNFNAGFPLLQKLERKSGICGPAAGRYGGRRPESEPESRNLATFIRHSNIYRLFSFHSQGEEIFYEYGNIPVPQGTEIAEILSKLSGYRLVQNDGLYSHGGLKDWFIKEFHRPGFTIEIGKGENPLPLSDLAPIYKKLRRMMAAGVIL